MAQAWRLLCTFKLERQLYNCQCKNSDMLSIKQNSPSPMHCCRTTKCSDSSLINVPLGKTIGTKLPMWINKRVLSSQFSYKMQGVSLCTTYNCTGEGTGFKEYLVLRDSAYRWFDFFFLYNDSFEHTRSGNLILHSYSGKRIHSSTPPIKVKIDKFIILLSCLQWVNHK